MAQDDVEKFSMQCMLDAAGEDIMSRRLDNNHQGDGNRDPHVYTHFLQISPDDSSKILYIN